MNRDTGDLLYDDENTDAIAERCFVESKKEMRKDTGGPAFPRPYSGTINYAQEGMTLRDYFAAKAMQGLLANPKLQEQILKAGQSWIEESAYAFADAMLEARKK
jgi:hypothetical protein